MSDSLWLHGLQRTRLPWLFPGVCTNLCTCSPWWHLTISSSASLFFICLQFFPGSGAFPMIWLFISDCQKTGAPASAPVLPMNHQDSFPLGLTDLTSLQSKELWRVFFSTTIQKYQSFSAQPSLWTDQHSELYITPGKTISWIIWTFVGTVMSLLFNTLSAAAAAAKSLQSCPTLCDPRDSSPAGSPVPGILQARTLECIAISFSNAWKWKVKVKSVMSDS